MNPLKTLFNKVFEATPQGEVRAEAAKEDEGFEWNPEEEVVPPTLANASSWKRTNVQESAPPFADSRIAESSPSLPAPSFERNQPDPASRWRGIDRHPLVCHRHQTRRIKQKYDGPLAAPTRAGLSMTDQIGRAHV